MHMYILVSLKCSSSITPVMIARPPAKLDPVCIAKRYVCPIFPIQVM